MNKTTEEEVRTGHHSEDLNSPLGSVDHVGHCDIFCSGYARGHGSESDGLSEKLRSGIRQEHTLDSTHIGKITL